MSVFGRWCTLIMSKCHSATVKKKIICTKGENNRDEKKTHKAIMIQATLTDMNKFRTGKL